MPSVCPKNWSQRDAGPNGAQPKSLAAPHFRFFGQILSLTKWNCAGIVVRAAFAVCLLCGSFDAVCQAQADAANSASQSPDLQEIVTLSRQHMDDSVITNYISSSGKTYKLGADDIIYLNSQGVSQGVISALLRATGPARSNLPPPMTPTTNSPVAPAAAARSACVPHDYRPGYVSGATRGSGSRIAWPARRFFCRRPIESNTDFGLFPTATGALRQLDHCAGIRLMLGANRGLRLASLF